MPANVRIVRVDRNFRMRTLYRLAVPPACRSTVTHAIAPPRWNRTFVMPEVRGVNIDAQTRCGHYNSPVDVIAVRMKCCGSYFACKDCHDTLAGHPLEPWPREDRAERAVLCGVCRSELAIDEYLGSSTRCPVCSASFNPHCSDHHDDYFSR
jgi:uncharacterized CHY-type Zn-finger protein